MHAIKTTVHNGRIELDAPEELRDGTEVLVQLTPITTEKIGIDESEWRDGPESLADWDAWIKTIEPLEFTAEEEAASARFQQQMRDYNIEAVRQQMQQGPLP
jgi:hypothetical protein